MVSFFWQMTFGKQILRKVHQFKIEIWSFICWWNWSANILYVGNFLWNWPQITSGYKTYIELIKLCRRKFACFFELIVPSQNDYLAQTLIKSTLQKNLHVQFAINAPVFAVHSFFVIIIQLLFWLSWPSRGWFHQHFTRAFFIQKCFIWLKSFCQSQNVSKEKLSKRLS